ncbi:B3 domain-containing protein [Hordeum vulgare]|nr:B3 domain-containing protein [Hordeum vulgare]
MVNLESFEYFTIILEKSSSTQVLLENFMKMLDGRRPQNMKLRQSGSGLRRLWDVEVVFDTDDHIYLDRGWKRFVRAYDLRHGYFLVFMYDDNAMFTVKVFNTTMCRMRYQDDDDANTLYLFFLSIRLCLTPVVKKLFCIWLGNGRSSNDSGHSKSSNDSGYSKSDSDSGYRKSSSEDEEEWSGEEEEESVYDEVVADDGLAMVVADDDLAMVVPQHGHTMVAPEDGNAMVVADDDLAMVVPEDGHAMVVPEDGNALVMAYDDLVMVVVPDDGLATVIP